MSESMLTVSFLSLALVCLKLAYDQESKATEVKLFRLCEDCRKWYSKEHQCKEEQ